MIERLQKVLAQAGIASRRGAEQLIKLGKVLVNGRLAKLGDKVTSTDKIKVGSKQVRINYESKDKVILYHKPVGEICTAHDPEGRPTVFDSLPSKSRVRWISIGRLDINTSGLLVFTNNGELANKLMHPSSNVEREYAVRVSGKLDPEQEKQLLQGVVLEDGKEASFNKIMYSGGKNRNHWYHVILTEGRNREVRKLFASLDLLVSRLVRVRYGDLLLPNDLKPGKSVFLSDAIVAELKQRFGV